MFLLRLGASSIVFFIIFSGGVLYTFNQTKVYRAEGVLEVLDPRPVTSLSLEDLLSKEPPKGFEAQTLQSIEEQLVTEAEDLNTVFEILGSSQIMMGVEQRIRGETRERFMAPYLDALAMAGPLSPMEILEANRSLERVRLSKIFKVRYIHPDPEIAAEITNLFMKELIDYYLKLEIDGYMRMVEDLRVRLSQIDEQIDESARVLATQKSDEQLNEAQVRILNDELEALYEFRRKLYTASQEAKVRVNLANPRARIVDPAHPPYADRPYKPDVAKNLSYAFSAALFFAALPNFWAICRNRS